MGGIHFTFKKSYHFQDYMLKEQEKYQAEQAKIQQEAFEFYKEQLDYKVQAYEDSWRQMMNMANQIGGEEGMGLGQRARLV